MFNFVLGNDIQQEFSNKHYKYSAISQKHCHYLVHNIILKKLNSIKLLMHMIDVKSLTNQSRSCQIRVSKHLVSNRDITVVIPLSFIYVNDLPKLINSTSK